MVHQASRRRIKQTYHHYMSKAVSAALLYVFLTFISAHGFAESQGALSSVVIHSKSGTHIVRVEIADTSEKRRVGLMFRRSLPQDQGMLFLFGDEQVINMWMKNTYLPLDMIFIGSDGRIRHIVTDTEPFSEAIISSQGAASAVLEMNAGSAHRMALAPGDQVDYSAFSARAK